MFPLTYSINKQLLPIFDKPMFYYPLSLMMLCGIKEYIFVINKGQEANFRKLLGNPNDLGIKISFVFGYQDHNFLTIAERCSDHLTEVSNSSIRQRLWKVRAKKVILATGSIERPMIFDNNALKTMGFSCRVVLEGFSASVSYTHLTLPTTPYV